MNELKNSTMNSNDAETAVLSILVKNPDMINQVINLKTHMFNSSVYSALYGTMLEIQEQKLVPEYNMIINYLSTRNKINSIGGEATLQFLMSQAFNEANLKEFERQVISAYKSRELVRLTASIPNMQMDSTVVDDVIISLQNSLNSISDSSGGDGTECISAMVEPAYSIIIQRLENPGLSGIPTGLKDIDTLTGGIARGELWVLASRPSIGKSALMCNSILDVATRGVPVLIFSLEMSKQMLMERFSAIKTGISLSDIRMSKLTQRQLELVAQAMKEFKELPIYIDCNYGMNLTYVLSTIRKYKKHHGIESVYLDYLQLLAEREEGQTAELGKISRNLKLTAGDLGIGVTALCQVNRSVESRDDKRPIMSDLRQSGNIEEDADIVAFLYRDDYYNPNSKSKGVLEYIIRKNRSGPIGTILFKFDMTTNKILGYS
jgi:replicative DNA helicase